MAELEPPLAKAPFLHQRTSSVSGIATNGYPKPLSSPRTSAPATPDKERGTDPLSAHIMARTQTGGDSATESPSFRRNLSELVIGKDKTSPDLSQPNHVVDPDKRDRKKRVSFFAKLRGKDHSEDHFDSTDDLSRAEGAQASAFARSETHKVEHPTYIRVRSSNKPRRDFNDVFLAQELIGGQPSRETASTSAEPKSCAIWSMKFSKDGCYLATGGQDMVVRVWRVLSSPKDRQRNETGEAEVDSALNAPVFCAKPYREYRGHTADVLDLSWSKNNFLLSSSMDKTVRLWHVTREECLCCFQHSDFVTSIAFHPKDDRFFLSGSLDCKLRLWNIPKKQVEFWNELPELITAVAFDPNGRMAIAGSFTGLCLFYETDGLRYHTQIHVRSTRGRNSHGSKITGIQTTGLQPDNPHGEVKLLITSNDSRIRLYNLRDKSLVAKFKGNENTCSQIRGTFSDDCKYIICGSEDRQVYIWNTEADPQDNKRKAMYEHFEAATSIVSATAFAPNKTRELLAASGDPIYETVQRNAQRRPSAGSSNLNPESNHDLKSYLSSTAGNIIVSADYTGCIKVFRQDSALHWRNKTDDKSELLSPKSKSALRPGSVVSNKTSTSQMTRSASTTSHDTTAVVRKPHEIIVPVSPARNKTIKIQEDEKVKDAPPPSLQFDSTTSIVIDDSHVRTSRKEVSHAHHPSNGTSRSTREESHERHHKKESSKDLTGVKVSEANPYIAPGGASFGFYDNEIANDSARPSALRQESTNSWSDSYQRNITCSECGHHAFMATRVGSEMRLKCQNCNHLVT